MNLVDSYHAVKGSVWQAAVVALTCALMVLAWQFLTVRYNYRGDWSALFCTGDQVKLPPIVAAEHPYTFPGGGWDGEFYHEIAHDPLLRRGTGPYIDSARLRYRRILIPATAYLLACGNDALVDTAYRTVVVLFFALGAWWLARVAQAAGKPALLGLAFFFLPASVAAIDREAVDVGLLSFCAGFAFYTSYVRNPRALYAILLLAGVVRDTGLLLTVAYCVWLLVRRELRTSAVFATAAAPAFIWYIFVNGRTHPYPGDGLVALPFSGVLHRMAHPADYGNGAGAFGQLLQGTDFLAAAGVLLAMAYAIRFLWRRDADPVELAALMFALLGIFVWRPGDWLEALDYGRILSPLLFFGALAALEGPPLPALVPLLMVVPRFGMEMAPQIFGVVINVVKGILTVTGAWL